MNGRHDRGARVVALAQWLLVVGCWQLACDRGRVHRPGAVASSTPAPSPPTPAPTASPAGAPPAASERLQPADLAYRGAFRLPDAFNWGARGLASFRGAGKASLLVLGKDLAPAEFARVAIPEPVVARDLERLPVARMVTPMRSFDGAIVEGINEVHPFASGIEHVPRRGAQRTDKLYGSVDNWYGVVDASHAAIWLSELDGTSPRGPFHVGPRREPFHGNKVGAFLFSVPAWYADAFLGGRLLVTGKARGAFFGSQGPSLFAFRPWDTDRPTGDLDALPLLYYRIRFPECAGPSVGDKRACDFPGFTMCDEWEGGSFVERGGRRAILLVGKKGLGPNHYGEPPRGDSCESDKGYHCDPFERQVLFYDIDELGAVARRARQPWTVLPYAVWRPREFFLQGQTCGQVGGMAFDPRSERLFMIEKGLGDHNAAAVHVWTVGS